MWTRKRKLAVQAADRTGVDSEKRQLVTEWVQALADAETSVPLGAVACPALGLDNDRVSHCLFETVDHRCYQTQEDFQIPVAVQRRFCLTAQYAECPVFQGDLAAWGRRHSKWPSWLGKRTGGTPSDDATDEEGGAP
jgi:hypothetical protein